MKENVSEFSSLMAYHWQEGQAVCYLPDKRMCEWMTEPKVAGLARVQKLLMATKDISLRNMTGKAHRT